MANALSLIERAYSLIGFKDPGEALSGTDTSYALGVLNDMIDSWNTQNFFIVSVQEVVATISGNPITVGPSMMVNIPRPATVENGSFVRSGGVDFPIEWITREEYNNIAYKTVGSNIPAYGYYDAALPTAKIYLYPYPTASAELHLQVQSDLSEFANLTTDYPLAQGYRRAIAYSLAEELAPGVRELPASVAKNAFLARKAIRKTNVVVPVLSSAVGVSNLTRFLSGV
jgi:hypothetical protein